MFKALDKVNYNTLNLNKPKEPVKEIIKPISLVQISCRVINRCDGLTNHAIRCVPIHLAADLLRAAIEKAQPNAISAIISNWPHTELCFKDILPPKHHDIFEEEMGHDLVVFRGVINRTKYCKLKSIDFRGLKLNGTFCKLIVQMWPILSLKKSQQKTKNLVKTIVKNAGVKRSRLTDEILPKMLEDLLCHEMVKNSTFSIYIPKGEKMTVKMDNLQFSTNRTFFMDYLICNGLRSITPLSISVSNICIKSDLMIGDDVMDCLAPFIVLRGLDPENIEGIELKQLEEGIFFLVASDLQKFKNVRALDLQDCNIYLQEGRTRSRTALRNKIVETLNCFSNLIRLDLSFNYLLGCLGEILTALKQPLEFLSLRGCDLNENDLSCLTKSQHAIHLKELNLSKVCQFSIYDNDRISPMFLLKITKHFSNVKILSLAQNHLPDASVSEFCHILRHDLKYLKVLDIAGNILTEENLTDITKALAHIKSMQKFRLTCTNNLLEDAMGPLDGGNNQEDLKKKFCGVLSCLGRDDIIVDIVRLSYAIFVDLVDIMDPE
ncbi:uncharacterized protein LOC134690855 [Mytilus trossulus]|uniref:uncharacterized protein LOC134690855 n=1 Tax=Mytilus trossulus TaxID=6551 RepID=UPI0030058A65